MTSVPGGSGTAAVRPAATAASLRLNRRPWPALSGVPEFREHAIVLPEHDVPAIVPPDVIATVAAHRSAQARVPDVGVLGQRHHLDAHQRQRRIATFADVGVEVLDQLLTAFAGIDAAAIEQHRAVKAMTAAEHRAAGSQVRGKDRRAGALAALFRAVTALLVRRLGHARI